MLIAVKFEVSWSHQVHIFKGKISPEISKTKKTVKTVTEPLSFDIGHNSKVRKSVAEETFRCCIHPTRALSLQIVQDLATTLGITS